MTFFREEHDNFRHQVKRYCETELAPYIDE